MCIKSFFDSFNYYPTPPYDWGPLTSNESVASVCVMEASNISTRRLKTKGDEAEYKMCENNPTSVMTIESLPTELLIHILRYLSPNERLRSEQVCKKWKDASRQTWSDVQTLYIIQRDQSFYYYRFKNLWKSHRLVEKESNNLFIGSDSSKIIRCVVSRVGCSIKKLIIDYRCSRKHKAILSIIGQYCHNLKVLELETIVSDCDEEVYSRLFECNMELHSISCGYLKNLIRALPLRDWRSLRLRIPVKFYDRSIPLADGFYEEKIISLIEHSEALEEFETEEYTTRLVEALLKLRNLKSLYFTTNETASLGMIFDVPLLHRLRNLVIMGEVNMDTNLLSNLLQHCCQLKRLVIEWETIPVILMKVILALPILETLQIHCSSMEDADLIRSINFRNFSLVDRGMNSAVNTRISHIIKTSEHLEKLAIEGTNVTSGMFKQLVGEISNRHKYLEVIVPYEIFHEVSEICAGSKTRLVKDLKCFRDYTD